MQSAAVQPHHHRTPPVVASGSPHVEDEAVLGRRDTGAGAVEPLAVYRRERPAATNPTLFGDVFTEYAQQQAMVVADAKLAGGSAPVYVYLFGMAPARHCEELRYMFRWNNDTPMADQISDTWLAFARTGDPNNRHIPNWAPHDATTRPTMVFDHQPRVALDPLPHVRGMWAQISVQG